MTNLRNLARRCQFEAAPTLAERLESQLLDQFIIGMSDAETRRRILRGLKISLNELYSTALLGETVIAHSKLLDVEQVASVESKEVIRYLARLFAIHGLPDVLVSDNGTSFDSVSFRQFCSAN
uniref:Integrase catalytic domain-containing protein n=1 Tax=Trichuris muris TaxID=70415 RepID=A0A5S6QV79_TRIMR